MGIPIIRSKLERTWLAVYGQHAEEGHQCEVVVITGLERDTKIPQLSTAGVLQEQLKENSTGRCSAKSIRWRKARFQGLSSTLHRT